MVKWLHTPCFMAQKCGDDCPETRHKCCATCEKFIIDFDTNYPLDGCEFGCKIYPEIHEKTGEFDFIPCGYFCKDYTSKSEN